MISTASRSGGITVLPIELKLRAGHVVVDQTAGSAELRSAIAESNRKARLDGLPDYLDPEIIDPEKAEAFVRGLSKLPLETLRPLADRTLFLNHPELMIGASAPTRAETFDSPFKIEITDLQGDVVLVRSHVQVDCPLARERATEARKWLNSATQDVKAPEARLHLVSDTPDQERQALIELSKARLRRFAVARAWEQNARAWTKCAVADSAAKADLEAAERAVVSYVVLRSSGMP